MTSSPGQVTDRRREACGLPPGPDQRAGSRIPDRRGGRPGLPHWAAPDIRADILSEAVRSGAAEPVAIHVRPEVHARIAQQAGLAAPDPAMPVIPLVVDDGIPASPGYEIHRAVH